MAIKLKNDDGFVYLALQEKVFTSKEKQRADSMFEDCKKNTVKIRKGEDLLDAWLRRGNTAKEMHSKYSITPNEEVYFWEMMYSAADIKLPIRSKNLLARNEFWLGAQLADYLPIGSKWLMNWTVFRELFEASAISSDIRIAKWMIARAIKSEFKNRDDMRGLLKKVRNRLKNIDTSVLSESELFSKLENIEY